MLAIMQHVKYNVDMGIHRDAQIAHYLRYMDFDKFWVKVEAQKRKEKKKKRTTIFVDPELYAKFAKAVGNVSESFQELMILALEAKNEKKGK
jgi:uncharacterized protein with PIN domain